MNAEDDPKRPSTAKRRPSMQDVADLAKVSKMTVSLALRGSPRISIATRSRIAAAAQELGYQFDPAISEAWSRMRTHNDSGDIVSVVLTPEERRFVRSSVFVARIVTAFEREAARLGFRVDWIETPPLSTRRLTGMLETRGSRSVYMPVPANESLEEYLRKWRPPAVATSLHQRSAPVEMVATDLGWSVRAACRDVAAHGFTRPGYLALASVEERTRREGLGQFYAWACGGGKELTAPLVFKPERTDEEIIPAIREWVATERPDVIISLEMAAPRWIRAAGLRCPEDLPCYCLQCQSLPQGQLGGIAQSPSEIGAIAARQLSAQMLHHNLELETEQRLLLVRGRRVAGTSYPWITA